jgi:type I restriction enzyme, S subunit
VRNHGLLNVGVDDFFALPMRIPPLREQWRVAEILDELDSVRRSSSEVVDKYKMIELGLLNDVARFAYSYATESAHGRWCNVGQVGHVLLGRQRSDHVDTASGQTRYLRVANVFDGYIDYRDVHSMGFTSAERTLYELRAGDILLNEGQSLELVGRSAIYDGPANMCFQNTLIRFRPSADLLSDYAYIIFRYWLVSGEFARTAKRTTSIAHLGADRFAAMRFPLIEVSEQRRLADRVKEVSVCIRRELIPLDKLRMAKKGLMDDLLTGKVRVGELQG